MAITEIRIPLRKVTEHLMVNVTVKGQRIFFARFWVGIQLLRLTRFVMGCNMEVDTSMQHYKHADRRKSAI